MERKNRVVKDAPERLGNDEAFAELPIVDRLHATMFISNVLCSAVHSAYTCSDTCGSAGVV